MAETEEMEETRGLQCVKLKSGAKCEKEKQRILSLNKMYKSHVGSRAQAPFPFSYICLAISLSVLNIVRIA